MLEDWPEELWSSQISPVEAEREMKGGAKAYLHFVRESEGDPDEESRFTRGHQVDLCSMANSVKSLAKNGGNSEVNSSSMVDPEVDLANGENSEVNSSASVNPNVDSTGTRGNFDVNSGSI